MDTAMHKAAYGGELSRVKDRLSQKDGARDLMAENKDGCVPLHLAARHLDPSVVREMLKAQDGHMAFNQLHVKSEDAYGCYAMHRACYAGAWESVKAMMEIGGEEGSLTCLHEPDADGYLPVQYAELSGRKDVVELMMDMDKQGKQVVTNQQAHVDEFKAKHPDLDGPYSDGTLTVNVAKCVGLLAADTNGKSDPYVKLTLEGESKQTKTVSKSLDPEYNEKFTFPINAEADSWLLQVEVFDKDKMASDGFIGGATVSLSKAFDGNWVAAEMSVELNDEEKQLEAEVAQQAAKRKTDGVMHPYGSAMLSLSFSHSGAAPEEAAAPAAAAPAAARPPVMDDKANKEQEKKDKQVAKAKQLEEKKAALAAKKEAKKGGGEAAEEAPASGMSEQENKEQEKKEKQAAKAKQLEEKKAALAAKKEAAKAAKAGAPAAAPEPAGDGKEDKKAAKAKQLEEKKAALAAKKEAAKAAKAGGAPKEAAASNPAADKKADKAKQLEERKAVLAAKKAERKAKKAGGA